MALLGSALRAGVGEDDEPELEALLTVHDLSTAVMESARSSFSRSGSARLAVQHLRSLSHRSKAPVVSLEEESERLPKVETAGFDADADIQSDADGEATASMHFTFSGEGPIGLGLMDRPQPHGSASALSISRKVVVGEVTHGTMAHAQGVPVNSVLCRINETEVGMGAKAAKQLIMEAGRPLRLTVQPPGADGLPVLTTVEEEERLLSRMRQERMQRHELQQVATTEAAARAMSRMQQEPMPGIERQEAATTEAAAAQEFEAPASSATHDDEAALLTRDASIAGIGVEPARGGIHPRNVALQQERMERVRAAGVKSDQLHDGSN